MIHELFASEFPRRDRTAHNKQRALERADHIISVSHCTKRDLCRLFSIPAEKVSVVHLGFDRIANPEPERAGTTKPFILYVGQRAGYKNFAGLLQAFASNRQLVREFELVAFGGGSLNVAEVALIRKLNLEGRVRQIGGSDSVLGALYRAARALVYPSKYEGFGLPPLEAMSLDCPVVASCTSSIPEVVGDAAELFDPEDAGRMASAISSVVFDNARRYQLIDSGQRRLHTFSWERCARETEGVYRSVLGRGEAA